MFRHLALLLLLAGSAQAAPHDFNFSWDTRVLEPGKVEAWFELTPRTGRREYYARFDSNGGAVLGVAKNLEAYLELDTSFDHSGLVGQQETADGRVTTYWRYHLLDAGDPLGLLVQLKVSAGFKDLVLGGRVVTDIRLRSLRLNVNAAIERTIYYESNTGITTRAEQTVGIGYMLQRLMLTPELEMVVQQSMTDEKFGGSAFFVGGGLTCQRSWGWFRLGMLVQAAAVKPEADVGDHEKLELRDHERFLFRFGIGVNAL